MDAFAGAIGVSDSDGKGTPVYNVCQPRPGVIARYYAHTVREMSQSQWILALAKGIRERSTDFRYEMFGNQRVPLPPPAEQAAIVRFLDWANGRLERTIRAKRKVIALLTKQKQTIIHRAVTRGLDTSVPLKPSGIPWLGDIPRHWEVSRVKNEFRCLNTQRVPLNALERGGMTSRIYDYYGASGVIDKVDDYIFDEELLLIAEDGANLVLRNLPLAIIARGKFWVNNHAHILKPKRGSILYLAHLLETLNYAPWISGAAQPKLTKDRLMSITIAVAPSDEQDAIVRHTAEQTRPLVTAISRLEREIELLREYRTRLVSDTVTGKLDVREAAEGLPDLKDDVASRETADEVAGAKELEEASGQEEAQG
jgi:type I restriction enzyme S subunit